MVDVGTPTETPITRRPWWDGVAPAYIGLFLWVVFFDQLPRETLGRGGLGAAVVGTGIGGCLCYLLFYLPSALSGVSTRLSLESAATPVFGVRGAVLVPGLAIGLTQVVVVGASATFGTALCLRGLTLLGLLDASKSIVPPTGEAGWGGAVYFVTALAWALATTLAGRYLAAVIIALMTVYALVPAAVLASSTLASFEGLLGPAAGSASGEVGLESPLLAVVVAVQMTLGFFAPSGLMAVEWGAESRGPDDVRKGGAVAVALAGWIIAILSFLTVLGSSPGIGGGEASQERWPGAGLTYTNALVEVFGEVPAGLLFQLLALTTLAPACYAGAYLARMIAGSQSSTQLSWGLTAAAVMAPVVAPAWLLNHRVVFGALGALCAPALGAMTAGIARGGKGGVSPVAAFVPAGIVAWVVGLVVGLAPVVGEPLGWGPRRLAHPWTLYAYLVAFVTYKSLSLIGFGPAAGPARGKPGADSTQRPVTGLRT